MAGSDPVGLCLTCAHARPIKSGRGSVFWLCERSTGDGRFPKYPRLPVTECAGFEQGPDAEIKGTEGIDAGFDPPAGTGQSRVPDLRHIQD